MPTLQLSNNAIGRLSSNAAAIDTSLVLEPGQGALFPELLAGQFFPVTLIRASDGAYEICKCTARAADVLTVERSQESTTAKAFLAGDRVEIRFTAGTFVAQIGAIEAAAAAAQADADTALAAAIAAQGDIDTLSAAGAIGTTNLATGSVTTATIAEAAVTAAKIADEAITPAKLPANLDLSSRTLAAYKEKVFAVTGTAPALSPNNGPIQTWTLTANSIPTLGTWAEGQSILLMIEDGTAYTIDWSSVAPVWKTNSGAAPALNTTGQTLISLIKIGSTIYGARMGNA